VNAKSDAGSLVVEALDAQGRSTAVSKPISADGLDIPVAWERGGLRASDGPVTLRIKLRNARLFAVWCGQR
jgi:hypothetical protein